MSLYWQLVSLSLKNPDVSLVGLFALCRSAHWTTTHPGGSDRKALKGPSALLIIWSRHLWKNGTAGKLLALERLTSHKGLKGQPSQSRKLARSKWQSVLQGSACSEEFLNKQLDSIMGEALEAFQEAG